MRYDYRDPGTDPLYCDRLSVLCPSDDCTCPGCVTDRVVADALGDASELPLQDVRFMRWLRTHEATDLLRRMVRANRELDAQLLADGLLDPVQPSAHLGVGLGEIPEQGGASLRGEEV